MECKTTSGIPTSVSLALAFKVGTVNEQNLSTFATTLNAVPAAGVASVNTGEAFTCRVWVKDALHALHMARVIQLLKSLQEIEEEALVLAETMRTSIEQGTRSALVVNETGYSTTS